MFDSFSNIDLFAFPFFSPSNRIRMNDKKKKKKNEEIKSINVQNEVFARFYKSSYNNTKKKNILKVRFSVVPCRIISSVENMYKFNIIENSRTICRKFVKIRVKQFISSLKRGKHISIDNYFKSLINLKL